MTLSAKWTAVSLFALTALGAGSMAFAGCTVTSGSPTDTEGGVVTPIDGGGGGDTSTPTDSAAPATCATNTNQKSDLINAQCQAALNAECCTELTALFTPTPAVDPTMDGNVYAACIADCKKPAADGAAPTTQEISDCETMLCDANASQAIQTAYDNLTTCASKPGSQSITLCQ